MPAASYASGTGFADGRQDGPVDRAGGEESGRTFVENLMHVCIRRLEFYQDSGSADPENKESLEYLRLAHQAQMRRRQA